MTPPAATRAAYATYVASAAYAAYAASPIPPPVATVTPTDAAVLTTPVAR